MGFFGDWQALTMFDSDIYDDKTASICETQIGQFRNSDGGGYILGHNYYVDGSEEYNADKIAIKGNESGKNVTAAVSLLRNADKLTFSVEDIDGNTVYSESLSKVSKTHYSSEAFYTLWRQKVGNRLIHGTLRLMTAAMFTKSRRHSVARRRQNLFRL